MPGNSKKEPEDYLTDEQKLERLAFETLKSLGWLIPQTPADVARAEAELASDSVELPESLRDPFAILDTCPPKRPEPAPATPDEETAELLARAAREGGEIPPEVEERMRQDRAKAEQDHDDEQH
ncbi:MAG: hypothetical protein L0Z62_16580 [Gemmataceae bacterium]|nr:hypothetical protein [Gemmataceae bacterium]